MTSGKKLTLACLVVAGTTAYMAYLGAAESWQYYLTSDECLANLEAFAGSQPVAFGDFLRDTSKDSYPTDTQSFVYSSTDLPVIADDPSQAKPFAIGSVAYGKDILSFRVGFPQFSKPVDIYLGLFIPATNPEVLLITPEKILKPLSEGFVPYASQTTGPIDEAILPDLPMSALPAVQYRLFSIVTPAGSLQSYSIWVTSFFGQYSLPGVAAAIVDAFEGDAYFDAPMLAMDSGYSLRQVADAAMSGRLLSTGDIKTSSGSMEPPANMAYGEIIAPTTKTGLSEWKPRSLTEIRMVMEEELKKNNWDAEEETKAFRKRIVTLMLGLAESGYSLPEIITGFLVDNIKIEDYGDRERTIFVDENGKRIPPAGSPPEQGVFSGTQGVPCPDADNDDYKTGAGCGDWAGDCDDTNPNRNPGMIEDCSDGIDNDCDGMVDDQDTGGCFPNCSQTDYPQTCGPTCIPAGAQCCEPGGGYCEVGWHCEYAQAKCCEDGKVLCPGNSGFCIPPGFEYQCP